MIKNLYKNIISLFILIIPALAYADISELPTDMQINNSPTTPQSIMSFGYICGDTHTVCLDNFTPNDKIFYTPIYAIIPPSHPGDEPRRSNVGIAFGKSQISLVQYQVNGLSEMAQNVGGSAFHYYDCKGSLTAQFGCTFQGTWYPGGFGYGPQDNPSVSITYPINQNKANTGVLNSTAKCNCDAQPAPGVSVTGLSFLDKLKKLLNPFEGDPVDILSGANVATHTDLHKFIEFGRTYSSMRSSPSSLGFGWKSNWDKKMSIIIANKYVLDNQTSTTSMQLVPSNISITEEDDSLVSFSYDGINHVWVNDDGADAKYILTQVGSTYRLKTPSHITEIYNSQGLFTQLIYPSGMTYNLSYSGNQLTGITDSYGHSLTLTYSNYANVILSATENNGDTVEYVYNNGAITSVTYNTNEVMGYVYDSNNLLINTIDELGHLQSVYVYDSSGKVSENWQALGNTKIQDLTFSYGGRNRSVVNQNINLYKSYFTVETSNSVLMRNINVYTQYYNNFGSTNNIDNNNNITSYTDTAGNQYSFTYDTNNNPLTMTKPDNSTVSYVWNSDMKPTQVTETSPNGTRVTNFVYDSNLNLISKAVTASGVTLTWTYTYGTYGKLLTMSEPTGNTTTYTYYADNHSNPAFRGQVNTVSNGLGHTVTINAYDIRGNITSITGINGITKTMTYDTRGRLLSETKNGVTNTYSYNISGDLLQANLNNGYTVNFSYDQIHRLVAMSDNNGSSNSFILDDEGQVSHEEISQGQSLITVKNKIWDGMGHVVKSWHNNASAKFSLYYDNAGNLNYLTDAANRNHNFPVNFRGQPVSDTVLNKSFTYDVDGNNTSLSWGTSQITSMSYDDFGQLTQLVSPDSGTTTYTHNIASRVDTKTDANGTVHTVTSDVLGRPVQIQHGSLNETFSYDASLVSKGQLSSVVDSSGTTSWNYDSLGLVSSKSMLGKTISYTHDNSGQLTGMTYPSGLTISYSYTNGQITSLNTSAGSLLTNIGYLPFSEEAASWSWGSTGSYNKQYTQNETLSSITDASVINSTVNQNEVGNIMSLSDPLNSINSSFTYSDSNNMLSGLGTSYSFDTNMNLTAFGSNALTVSQNKIAAFNTSNYSYDNNGNVLGDGIQTYGYDVKNNLASVTKVGTVASYTFNALNQRISKTVNGVTIYFVYNENHQLIGEYDSIGNIIAEHIYFNGHPVGLYKMVNYTVCIQTT